MEPKFKPDAIETGLVMKYDDVSMKEKFESLSADNKTIIDNEVNQLGQFPFENIVEIILSANEEQRKEISSMLGDIRMVTDKKVKEECAHKLVKYLNEL